jgi:lipopolysaccharide biosynthesis glycosyltransferase
VSDSPQLSVWLGYDSREALSFAIARYSIRRYNRYIPVYGLVLEHLVKSGLYERPTKKLISKETIQLWDTISNAPMSTEFSNSRFLVPLLAKSGWALFADSDIIVRSNIAHLFDLARPDKALMCVKHHYEQTVGIKKIGQLQTVYPRKNWSSVMLFNCDHPSNKRLTIEYVNSMPGRDLHRFCWLNDDEIGELPPEWNYCVGHSKLNGKSPAIVHFTEGLPDMPGYATQEYADEWRSMMASSVGAL